MNLGDLIEKNFSLPREMYCKSKDFAERKRLEGTKKLKNKIFNGFHSFYNQRILSEKKYEEILIKEALIKNHEEFEKYFKGQEEVLKYFEDGKHKYLKIFPFPSMGDMRYRVEIENSN